MHDKNAEIRKVCDNTLDIIAVRETHTLVMQARLPIFVFCCSLICSPVAPSSRNTMRSGGGRFSPRSSVSITTSGWRWSRVAKLMSLNHIYTIMTTTGQIYSTAQVQRHTEHVHVERSLYSNFECFQEVGSERNFLFESWQQK